eukprot:2963587-Prymnesium_polylepis.1
MPMLVLVASICPDGAMSSVYALVTSIQCTGGTVGNSISSLLTVVVGVSLSDWSSLPLLVVICLGCELL